MTDFCKICDPKCKHNDCICNENFSNFYDTYNELRSITQLEKFNLVKNWGISTMTICCSFNSDINLEKYINVYCSEITGKTFYNCINAYTGVKYQSKNRISIKIFSNGNIQLAGVLNVMSATYAIRKIYRRLCNLSAFASEAFISNVRICMINSDFKIDKNIKQANVCKFLDSKEIESVKMYSFNPSKYPGINIKFSNPINQSIITCAMFRPGSIIVTGGNDINAYKFVLNQIFILLQNNNDFLY
tara:strand:+ start:4545 stop:5279 length:735 start_codon:yes stop_codon:yes gene_type:complete